jgi:dolichyl-phosphate-mannose-protein mannosyltransferase
MGRDLPPEVAAVPSRLDEGQPDGSGPDDAGLAGGVRSRMVPPMPDRALWGWVGPLLVTALGAFLRFNRLSVPRAVVFDETYYVSDAWGILRHGVEISPVGLGKTGSHALLDRLLAHGSTNILAGTQSELVAHPPLGKEMIAVGEWLFGLTPFGWRFSVALIGSLSILLLARIVRRMTRSTLLGCVAGLLMALDGLEFVLSRTAILDIFVMFWVLAAFGCLVIDRDRSRAAIAAAAAAASDGNGGLAAGDGGPRLGIRWLRIAAGLCLGAATASKWNGAWYILAFAALAIAWDLGARRAAGYPRRLAGTLRSDILWLPVTFAVIPAAVYIASWTGWFATPYGYDRNGTAFNGGHHAGTLLAWFQYNKWMLQFGLGLTSGQTYKSNPLGWLVLARPISFYSICAKPCGAGTEQEVLAIGTPLIWWGAAAALVVCAAWWLRRRDWRAGAVLVSVAAGWLPWIWFYLHDQRTEFYYYAIAFEPFLIIAITLCLGLIIGPERASPARRAAGAVAAGTYALAVLLNFAYLYPVLAAQVIPYSSWLSRIWFHSWI